MTSKPTVLHLISHTHWDREWYQPFQLFRVRLIHMLDRLLALFENDPHFKYFMLDGQTIILEDYLAIRPEREAQIKDLIQSGRLLIGPWYILSDEFLVSPEAIIRNLLEGRRLCVAFGGLMPVGYTPDPFGHIGQMPQILHGFGIDTACFWRGLDEEPCEVRWAAPDGSEVLVSYLCESYSNAANLPMEDGAEFTTEVERLGQMLSEHSLSRHLLLMNGTDHAEPSPRTSACLDYAQEHLSTVEIRHSTLPEYFSQLKDDLRETHISLPLIVGELRASRRMPLLPGVLSTRMWIKQRNHLCQNLLESWAEPFNVWAAALQTPNALTSPFLVERTALIHQAWRILMQCHPHDSICGCSIDSVHQEMRSRFDQVEQIAEEVTRQSLEILSAKVDTTLPGYSAPLASAIIVFNPAPGPRTDRVEAAFTLPDGVSRFEIINDQGQSQPHQFIGLGGQELFRATLDRAGFLNSVGMIREGAIAGMAVQAFRFERKGDRLEIDVTLSQGGQVNLDAWNRGSAALKSFLSDPSIQTYSAYAHSPAFTQIIFLASDLPGFGYRTFWVRPLPAPAQPPAPLKIHPIAQAILPVAGKLLQHPLVNQAMDALRNRPQKPESWMIENESLRISLDLKNGTLTLLDKRSQKLYPGLNRFVDGGDRGDEYNYCPPDQDHSVAAFIQSAHAWQDDLESRLEIDYGLYAHASLSDNRQSRSARRVLLSIHCQVRLIKGVPRVEIRTEIDNQAKDHRLRVHFPLPFQVDAADYDGHFEQVRRPLKLPIPDSSWVEMPRPEVPQRRFTHVQQAAEGMLLAARGLPEVETAPLQNVTEIRLTLLRCVGWLSRDDLSNRQGHAGPGLETPEAQMPGKHTFEYALIPFQGDAHFAENQAVAFDLPLRALTQPVQMGSLSSMSSLFETTPDFDIQGIKTAEDSTGIILRGVQRSGPTAISVRTSLPLDHCEQVRLDETPLKSLALDGSGFASTQAAKWEIVTFKWSQK